MDEHGVFIDSYNVGKTILNHPFGNGLYQLFIVIWGMVYYCFTHIRWFNLFKRMMLLGKLPCQRCHWGPLAQMPAVPDFSLRSLNPMVHPPKVHITTLWKGGLFVQGCVLFSVVFFISGVQLFWVSVRNKDLLIGLANHQQPHSYRANLNQSFSNCAQKITKYVARFYYFDSSHYLSIHIIYVSYKL